MNRFWLCIGCFLGLLSPSACAQQETIPPKSVADPAFEQELQGLLSLDVPLISVGELAETQDQVYLFDTREWEEYQTSHIPGAQYLGYQAFKIERLDGLPKDAPIVLYCSVGYRSERIGRKLGKMGFTNVRNLIGSIFEWANQAYPLVDANGAPTQLLHTYNRSWSQWVRDSSIQKVW